MKVTRGLIKKVLLVFAFLVGTTAIAQKTPLTIGPKLGLNVSSFDNGNYNSRIGLNAGAFFVYSPAEHIGLTGDILLVNKGAENDAFVRTASGMQQWTIDTRLTYAEVPVQFTYFFLGDENRFRPKLGIGPSFNFLVKGKTTSEVTSSEANTISEGERETEVTDQFERFEFGAVAMAGFNFEIQELTWLNFDIRYNYGLTPVNKSGDELKSRGVSLLFGLAFPVGTGYWSEKRNSDNLTRDGY